MADDAVAAVKTKFALKVKNLESQLRQKDAALKRLREGEKKLSPVKAKTLVGLAVILLFAMLFFTVDEEIFKTENLKAQDQMKTVKVAVLQSELEQEKNEIKHDKDEISQLKSKVMNEKNEIKQLEKEVDQDTDMLRGSKRKEQQLLANVSIDLDNLQQSEAKRQELAKKVRQMNEIVKSQEAKIKELTAAGGGTAKTAAVAARAVKTAAVAAPPPCKKKPKVDLDKLKKSKTGEIFHCEARHKICADQNRLILFENKAGKFQNLNPERHNPLWQGSATINLPGYHDGWKQTQYTRPRPRMRANSSADPPFLKDPKFNDCETALVYAPTWPYNVGESYGNTLLAFAGLARSGALDRNVQIVFEVDGLEINSWFKYFMKPFSDKEVMSFADFSKRNRTSPRCYKEMVFCFGAGGHNWNIKDKGAFERTAKEIQDYFYPKFVPDEKVHTITFAARKSYNVMSRHIVNVDDLQKECKTWGAETNPFGAEVVVKCELFYFEEHTQAEILQQMMKTNTMIDWPDFFAKDFGGSDIIHYYTLLNTHKDKSQKAFFEEHPEFGVRGSGRDRSTTVIWTELLDVLTTISEVNGDHAKFAELPTVIYPKGIWEDKQTKANRHEFTKKPPGSYYRKIAK